MSQKTARFSLIAVVLLLLSSCSNKDYLKAIPEDAAMVMSVNFRALYEKSDFAESSIKEKLDDMADDKISDALGKYLKDPMAMGLDITQPVYMFVGEKEVGFVAKVDDDDDLEEFISALYKEDIVKDKPKEKNDVMCGKMDGSLYYAFNSDAFLLVAPIHGTMSPSALAKMLKGDHKTFVDTDGYKKMEEQDDKDVLLYMNGKHLSNYLYDNMNKREKQELEQAMSASPIKMEDIDMLASLNFTDGSAVLSAKTWGANDKAQKKLDDYNKEMRTIQGTYIKSAPKDLLAWACVGMNGSWYMDILTKNDMVRKTLNDLKNETGMDLEAFVRTLDGDMAAAVPGSMLDYIIQDDKTDYDSEILDFDFSFKAKVKSPSSALAFAESVKTLADTEAERSARSAEEYGWDYDADGYLRMERVSDKEYSASIPLYRKYHQYYDVDYDWYDYDYSDYLQVTAQARAGVSGNDLYIATPNAMNYNGSSTLDKYSADIKQSTGFMYINLGKILRIQNSAAIREARKAGINLEGIDAFIIKGTPSEVTLQIDMEDKKTNFLKQLFE